MKKLTILFSIIATSSVTFSAIADEHPSIISEGETEYGFDPMLFRGTRISQSLNACLAQTPPSLEYIKLMFT